MLWEEGQRIALLQPLWRRVGTKTRTHFRSSASHAHWSAWAALHNKAYIMDTIQRHRHRLEQRKSGVRKQGTDTVELEGGEED